MTYRELRAANLCTRSGCHNRTDGKARCDFCRVTAGRAKVQRHPVQREERLTFDRPGFDRALERGIEAARKRLTAKVKVYTPEECAALAKTLRR